ncbi:transcription-repair coupling factor [Flexistipes sp.]|uniref:transcription-repair coupling factor n=1 Tax=Flexistipes sp. TaxID=3088135 RepID=UPI002E22403E|nr:transcription-repair coupling factor [Flexistipes sp.]
MKGYTHLWGASKLHFLKENLVDDNSLNIIIVDDPAAYEKIVNEANFFLPHLNPVSLPPYFQEPFELARVLPEIFTKRANALNAVLNNETSLVITTLYGLLKKLPPKDVFLSSILDIEIGTEITREEFIYYLDILGFVNVEIVDGIGEYAFRGDIFDLLPPGYDLPVRIEFFDDDVEQIYLYKPDTQRKVENLEKIKLMPATEGIFETEEFKRALKGRRELEEAELFGKFAGFHWFAPLVYDKMDSFFDYTRQDVKLYFLSESGKSYISVFYDWISEKSESREEELVLSNFVSKNVLNDIDENSFVHLVELDTSEDLTRPDYGSPRLKLGVSKNVYESLDKFIHTLKSLLNEKYIVIAAIGSSKFYSLLKQFCEDYSVGITEISHLDEAEIPSFYVYRDTVSGGFTDQKTRTALFSDEDIFGFSKKRKKSRNKEVFKTSLSDLSAGDYIVHVDYGIGIFKGLVHKSIGGIESDFLELEYDKGEILYVPLESINLIQKYVGSGESSPRISSLQSSKWSKLKNQAKKSAKKLAMDLLKLYAERKALNGFSFQNDGFLVRELENSFLFEETEDQLSAILDVYRDMEADYPMERLVCGDVGFGKTEVAVRAAGKAVAAGKQVAVLAPTTVLTRQHFESFRQRFNDLPVKIDYISRLKTPKEIKKTLKKVADGEVDILIGTHRLLSTDVHFNDLGLLVIDEEQRFGVAHKEKISDMRSNIDVLTLTATPIPRTLQLSISGIRDISVIETPPADRLPIITKIVRQDGNIGKLIENEMKRGGQVYFLHNNVKDIVNTASWVQSMAPYARVDIAHGQMSSIQLEKALIKFYEGETDVLVCTTIIENGVDIANANTIIVNSAGNFGLAQLYQLKGRVGRSDKRAYCYLVVDNLEALNQIAKKRLQIIQQLSDLGSGFKIASYDLQLRGAGDLLGAEQSGFVTNIGYELYLQMVHDAVKELQGKGGIKNEVEIQSNVSYYIPAEYVPNPETRMNYYNRISGIAEKDDVDNYMEEFQTIYGDIPEPVKNLLKIFYIKNLASGCGVIKLTIFSSKMKISFDKNVTLDPAIILNLISELQLKANFSSEYEISIVSKENDILETSIAFFESLAEIFSLEKSYA